MEQIQYLNDVITDFESLLKEFGGQVIPCTCEEVDLLESMIANPYHLPAAYKEFLIYGGKKMAGLFGRSDLTYNTAKLLLERRYEDILEMLETCEAEPKLPTDIFVISEYLAAHFNYIRLTEGDDPPVYSWVEHNKGGLEVAKQQSSSFSGFLTSQILRHKKFLIGQREMSEKYGN